MTMTYVFVNIGNPKRVKMIEARRMEHAKKKLAERLVFEPNSGFPEDYVFGYFI